MNFIQKACMKVIGSQKLLSSEFKISLKGYMGVGKTTLCAALHMALTSRIVKNKAAEISLDPMTKNMTLEAVCQSVKQMSSRQFPTQHKIAFDYNLLYLPKTALWPYEVGRLHIYDNPGGWYDAAQQDRLSSAEEISYHDEFKQDDGVIVLFSLEQFDSMPLNSQGYMARENIYNFLNTINEVTEGKIPVVIVINHCVIDGKPQNEKIKAAAKILSVWIADIFKDIDFDVRPHVYFVDSVAAIQGDKDMLLKTTYPILDLIRYFLQSGEKAKQKNRFIWGDIDEAKYNCNVFIRDVINGGGVSWQ